MTTVSITVPGKPSPDLGRMHPYDTGRTLVVTDA